MRTSLLLLSSIVAVYFGFFAFNGKDATDVVAEIGYWSMLVTFVLLVWSCVSVFYSRAKELRLFAMTPLEIFKNAGAFYQYALPGCFVISISSILLSSQPMKFKIVMDEPVLVATSLGMHLDRDAYGAAYVYQVDGMTYRHGKYVDKRPLFYPFLLSVIHDWTGYRVHQGIWLNACLLVIFLGLCYRIGCGMSPPLGGYLAVLLMAGVPLLAVNGTSSGFDMLNLVLLLLLLSFLPKYVKVPTALNQDVLVILAVALANTRYESVMFILPVVIAILHAWWQQKRLIVTPVLVITPLLMICYPLQRKIMGEYEAFWQLPVGATRPFDLGFLPVNLQDALEYLFSFNDVQPNSWLLSASFIIACIAYIYYVLTRRGSIRWARRDLLAFAAIGLVVLGNFFLLMCYHWGQLTDPAATRLVLPLICFQVFFIVGLFHFAKLESRVQVAACLICAIFFIATSRPMMARTDFLKHTMRNAQMDYSVTLSDKLGENVLLISDRSLGPSLTNVSSLAVRRALSRLPQLELHHRLRTFDEIYVLYLLPTKLASPETFEFKEMTETKGELETSFNLETVELKKINDAVYLRLAKVTEIRIEKKDLLDLNMTGLSISYTGKLTFQDPQLPAEFVKTLP